MTIGDIFEKIRRLFGGESAKIRGYREQIKALTEKIRLMEDGNKEIRREIQGLDTKVNDLKAELKRETSPHSQDLLMDEIERYEKEFVNKKDHARIRGINVDAARSLKAKLEQLLEMAQNGINVDELEDVLDKVKDMKSDLADAGKILSELDKQHIENPADAARRRAEAEADFGAAAAAREAAEQQEAAERAARRRKILGEAATPTSAAKENPATVSESAAQPPAPSASAQPESVAASI